MFFSLVIKSVGFPLLFPSLEVVFAMWEVPSHLTLVGDLHLQAVRAAEVMVQLCESH